MIPTEFLLDMVVCVLQRTRGQKRKRVPICEDREDKPEVSNLFPLKLSFCLPFKCIHSSACGSSLAAMFFGEMQQLVSVDVSVELLTCRTGSGYT